jgi:hypothetical protein
LRTTPKQQQLAMEAKNLRIGNFVSDLNASDSFFAKVKKLDYSRCYYGQFHSAYSDLKPIPITEEWLIKFGFNLVVKEGNQGEFRVYQLNEITYNTNHGWWWRHQLTVQPKYVHELQNLFFAIIGTELELKTDV